MSAAARRWAGALLAGLVSFGCGAKGCGSPPPATGPATVERTLAACDPYAEVPDLFGYCLAHRAVNLPELEGMEAVCARAGGWEKECRGAWVDEQDRRRTGLPVDVLLRACGPNEDCAFQLLDGRFPEDDVLAAVARCGTYVKAYERDCVAHALSRWVAAGKVDAAEAARVIAGAPSVHADVVGRFVGVAAACTGAVDCDAKERSILQDACRVARDEQIRTRRPCPTR